MKSVLISIQPKYCKLIASGQKTVEVRKTRPKIEPPFKCYVYCTLAGSNEFFKETLNGDVAKWNREKWADKKGNVIGEFVCDRIADFKVLDDMRIEDYYRADLQHSCLYTTEISEYIKSGNTGYAWHISDFVLYDKPLRLDYFVTDGDCDCMNCRSCSWFNRGNGYNVEDDCDLGYENIYRKKTLKPLFRPPQSWQYVEEL